ncbi:MAG: inositol monophosphatase family protein [Spirochaetales bacterium]|nr:inositol monophosphatase family protein [Spirochaetales bacterium]
MDINLTEYLDFARNLSIEAGKITLKYFRKEYDVERKKDNSPVTVADRETEYFIRNAIIRRFPDHGIIGEEHGSVKSDSPFKWIIDPIDGTKSFIHGVPLYTVLIALVYEGEPCVGVIHNPMLEETAAAATRLGCTLNGEPCRVSKTKALEHAWIQTTDPAKLIQMEPGFAMRIMTRSGQCRTWADGYGYLLVASGRADVMIDPIVAIWDVAPLKVVITEAGGTFTDFQGESNGLGESAIATNGLLHKEVLTLIQ